jgi:hypothetical protein
MPWYLDIILMIGLVIGCHIALTKDAKKRVAVPVKTKDGYSVGILEMQKIEQKRTLTGNNKWRSIMGNLYLPGTTEDFMSITLFITGLSYVLVGNTLDYFFLIPNEVMGFLAIIGMFYWSYVAMKQCVSEASDFIGQLYIDAPSDFKQYGQYVKNPFDVFETLTELQVEEEEWEKMKTRRDIQGRELIELNRKGDGERLEYLENQLTLIGKKVTLRAGLLTKNLLTDNPPAVIREIIEANQKLLEPLVESELKEPKSVEPKKNLPHYIEVMKEITLNPHLPSEVIQEAQDLIDAYESDEAKRKRQKVVDDALLEINTAKKYLV